MHRVVRHAFDARLSAVQRRPNVVRHYTANAEDDRQCDRNRSETLTAASFNANIFIKGSNLTYQMKSKTVGMTTTGKDNKEGDWL